MSSIRHLASGYDVAPLAAQLAAHPEAWSRHTMRTDAYRTPHKAVDDIWVRYNAWENFAGDVQAFNAEHESSWYPVIADLPAAWSLARKVLRDVGGGRLGGVLITRIPPGGRVNPHVDTGWHAGYYEKFAVQIASNESQAFCFEDAELRPLPGDLYTFDNSRLHWVTNDSDTPRITLIVCVRRDRPMLQPDERIPFDMYFASIASMQVHPGAGTKEHRKLTLEECRDMALQMIAIRRAVAGKEN
jgi:hypothetical protein